MVASYIWAVTADRGYDTIRHYVSGMLFLHCLVGSHHSRKAKASVKMHFDRPFQFIGNEFQLKIKCERRQCKVEAVIKVVFTINAKDIFHVTLDWNRRIRL